MPGTSKAAHAVHKMSQMAPGNVSTISPTTGSTADDQNMDVEPGQMAHGGVKGHGHDGKTCAAAGCAMRKGGVH